MKSKEILIEGMNCGHCVMAVKKELGKIDGLTVEDVQVGKARVLIDEEKVPLASIERAVDDAGFKIVSVN